MQYGSVSIRGGAIKGEILAHAVHKEVLVKSGEAKRFPRKQGTQMTYRRYLPYGAIQGDAKYGPNQNRPVVQVQPHLMQEGVTPDADELDYVDIKVTIDQYGCLYTYTDKTEIFHEDNIPEQQRIQIGERMGLLREMIRWGELRGGTNKWFAGGVDRSTVTRSLSVEMLRDVADVLYENHCMQLTQMIAPSEDYGTSYVEPSWIVYGHTSLHTDLRRLPDFTKVENYANRQQISDCEIGSFETFRFLLSPELKPYKAAGASVGATGLRSSADAANAQKIDVYPLVVVGRGAWANLALRGMNSFAVNHVPINQPSKVDPMNQRGYMSAKFWDSCFIQNQGWMGVLEVGATRNVY